MFVGRGEHQSGCSALWLSGWGAASCCYRNSAHIWWVANCLKVAFALSEALLSRQHLQARWFHPLVPPPRSFQVRRGDLRTSSWTRCPGRWSAWGHGGETPSPLPSEPPCHIKTYNTLHLSPTSHNSTAPPPPPHPYPSTPLPTALQGSAPNNPVTEPLVPRSLFLSSQARLSRTSEFHSTPRSRSEECSD